MTLRNRAVLTTIAIGGLVFLSSIVAVAKSPLASFVSAWEGLETAQVSIDDADTTRKHIVSGDTLDLASLNIFSETLPAGSSAAARVDAEAVEELLIIKSGELEVSVGKGAPIILGPGSVAVTYPGEQRNFRNVASAPATYYVFNYRTHLPPNLKRGAESGGSIIVDWSKVDYAKSEIGGRRQIFDRPTAMFDNFEMHVSTLNQGLTNHAAHTHRAEEFVLMIKGEVEMLIGDETVQASTGDLIYIESMIPHSLNNTGAGETMYFAFQFWQ